MDHRIRPLRVAQARLAAEGLLSEVQLAVMEEDVAAEIAAKDLTERAIMWPALGGEMLREEALA